MPNKIHKILILRIIIISIHVVIALIIFLVIILLSMILVAHWGWGVVGGWRILLVSHVFILLVIWPLHQCGRRIVWGWNCTIVANPSFAACKYLLHHRRWNHPYPLPDIRACAVFAAIITFRHIA